MSSLINSAQPAAPLLPDLRAAPLPGQTLPAYGFPFVLLGDSNRFYEVEFSGDLSHWAPLAPCVATNVETTIVDSTAVGTNALRRFYRARLLPGGPFGTNFVVAAFAGEGGDITPAGFVPVNLGGSQSFTALPATNYLPAAWFVDTNLIQMGGASFQLTNVTADQQVAVTFTALADLGVTAAATPNPVNVLSNLTYTVTVSNAGPATATGIWLTNALPSGLTFVSADASQGTCGYTNGVLACAFGVLNATEVASLQLVVLPQTPGTVTNVFTATANEFDLNPTDNSAAPPVTVVP
jgi:uncharacterized repeat protein (TIGR01451 family)